ncbi:MAG: phospholipid carrier-dependent glycosyltransferase [Tissierellales bacterium]|nr:phospholipid carrier-dependent glycosyltransferase [Tissierellales bacterium]MBN2826711.1 phospholipid carrier-dependent glycosyltransferase [Tissierellales bacterium]
MKFQREKFIHTINNPMFVYLFIYFLVNLLFLDKFPFVHSDESWLSGLSRNYLMTGRSNITETFFDLYPRFPHAIKIIFHWLQAFFISTLGYSVFTVRLISLSFSCLTLVVFYKLVEITTRTTHLALFITILFSLDSQYIYASHFARQEIIMLFLLLVAFYFYHKSSHVFYKPLMLSMITGIAVGIHPNSFTIAVVIGCLYIIDILLKKEGIGSLIMYILFTGLFALIYVKLSLYFDPNFIANYAAFGDQFGVLESTGSKTLQIINYYLKLYYGVSGTYYTPNIRFQLILFAFLIVGSIIRIIKKGIDSKLINYLTSILAINLSYIIVGRYNQTSILFIFPFCWIIFGILVSSTNIKRTLTMITLTIVAGMSLYNIVPFLNNDYDNYIRQISYYVAPSDIALANLNSEFYFDNGSLLDYRNLAFLKEANVDFESYITANQIDYIIYPQEMDYIYSHRPIWNGIYGNLYYYFDDMHNFIKENCTLIHEFESPYAMRIVRFMYTKEWTVKIYKVQ